MVPFKKITQGERNTIDSFLARQSEKSLLHAIKSFADNEDTYYAIVEDMLVMRREKERTYYYTMPYGRGQLRYVLMQLMENAKIMGCKCAIVLVDEDDSCAIESAMPGHFSCNKTDDGTIIAEAVKDFSDSVFNNNESMVPAW